MMGAIIGDLVGSVYEWNNRKSKDFPLFREDSFFTDDSVMTVAVAEALMEGGTPQHYIQALKKWGRRYPEAGYGSSFYAWLFSEEHEPYHSWGNGSAMRVSPCAWAFDTLEEVEDAAKVSAAVTHSHPEGIKGAEATAVAIFLARKGHGKAEIKKQIEERYGYDLHRTLEEIRPDFAFDESCQKTVPEAITAFLESTDFEDALRNAISLGGDSDTLAAITGSIAEAAYGIPEEIRRKALTLLPEPLREVVLRWEKQVKLPQT